MTPHFFLFNTCVTSPRSFEIQRRRCRHRGSQLHFHITRYLFLLTHTWWCENITASPCGCSCWSSQYLRTRGTSNYRNHRIFTETPLDITEIPIISYSFLKERYNIVLVFYDGFIQISLCMCTVGMIYQQANR